MREFLRLRCELQINPADESSLKQMEKVEAYFLNESKPLKFNPYEKDNILMTGESNFESLCATMEENGVSEPKKLSEYEFYSRIKYYEEKYKAAKSASK